ncbi:hypothetical protein Tco_1548765 [Tanacetum coccineum]
MEAEYGQLGGVRACMFCNFSTNTLVCDNCLQQESHQFLDMATNVARCADIKGIVFLTGLLAYNYILGTARLVKHGKMLMNLPSAIPATKKRKVKNIRSSSNIQDIRVTGNVQRPICASSSERNLPNRNVRRRLAIIQSSIPTTNTRLNSEIVLTKIPELSSMHTQAVSPSCEPSSSSTSKRKSLPHNRLSASSSGRSLPNRNVRRRIAINQSSIPTTSTRLPFENVSAEIP